MMDSILSIWLLFVYSYGLRFDISFLTELKKYFHIRNYHRVANLYTVCTRSHVHFYKCNCCTEMDKTSWIYSILQYLIYLIFVSRLVYFSLFGLEKCVRLAFNYTKLLADLLISFLSFLQSILQCLYIYCRSAFKGGGI